MNVYNVLQVSPSIHYSLVLLVIDSVFALLGYLCQSEAISNYKRWPCPAGSVCLSNATVSPTPCPGGTYRDITGGGDLSRDCFICPGGHKCKNGMCFTGTVILNRYCILSIVVGSTVYEVCEEGVYCKPGSLSGTICPAGYFCPSNTSNPLICPANSFCPSGSSTPRDCK